MFDVLNGPDFQCNHEPGTHAAQVGGRNTDGSFSSSDAAAYPDKLLDFLARAFTLGRTGSSGAVSKPPVTARPPSSARAAPETPVQPSVSSDNPDGWWQGLPTPADGPPTPHAGGAPVAGGVPQSAAQYQPDLSSAAPSSPQSPASAATDSSPVVFPDLVSPPSGPQTVSRRSVRPSTRASTMQRASDDSKPLTITQDLAEDAQAQNGAPLSRVEWSLPCS